MTSFTAQLSPAQTLPAKRVAPHRLGGHTTQEILRAWSLAACIAALFGVALFGIDALRLIAIAVATGGACDIAISLATRRRMIGGPLHSALSGLLIALTLPPQVGWYVPMLATMVAVLAAKGLFSSLGHYIWQPAMVGRVVAQFKDVAKSYGEKAVLGDVNFTIERGDRIALVGVNGAGKSTLIKLLAGTEVLTRGEYTLGHNVTPELRKELLDTVRRELGPVAVIGDLNFVRMLPKTRSGKIMRRVLKAVILDKDPGDITTIEDEGSVEEARLAWTQLKKDTVTNG